jgi:hypothetical protein
MLALLFSAHHAAAGDPKAECISAVDQGQSLRDDGKFRAAREKFVTCSKTVCPKPIIATCSTWLKQLDEGMPSIVLGAKDPRGSDVVEVRVSFDGDVLSSSLDGKPIQVDPGPHKLRFEHEGSEPVEQSLVIRAGEKMRVVSVTLPDKATAAAPPLYDAPEKKSGPGIFTARNVLGTSLIVLGAGAFVTGLVFGLSAQSDGDRAQAIRMRMPSTACRGGVMTQDCVDLGKAVDSQNSDASISVVFWVVSGVLVAGGITTFLAWPSSKETTAWVAPAIGPHQAGAAFGTTF